MERLNSRIPLGYVISSKPVPAHVPKDRERLVVQGHGHNIGVTVVIEIPKIQAHARDEFPVFD